MELVRVEFAGDTASAVEVESGVGTLGLAVQVESGVGTREPAVEVESEADVKVEIAFECAADTGFDTCLHLEMRLGSNARVQMSYVSHQP